MKLKKLVSAVVCAAMACVFAVSAFAYDADMVGQRRKEAVEYLTSRGYESAAQAVAALDDKTIGSVMDSGYNIDTLKGSIDSYEYAAQSSTEDAINYITQALNTLRDAGIDVGTPTFTVVNGAVVVDVTIGGVAVNESVNVPTAVASASSDEHPDIAANKDENGNWHVDEATTAAASSVTTTAGGVIKATGDNSAVVLVAGVLVVAAVLGLAVRKNSNVG